MWYGMFLSVLKMSFTAGVTVILVLVVRLFLKRAPKMFSYVLWFVVLFRLLCPVSFSSDYSVFGLFSYIQERIADTITEPQGEWKGGNDGKFVNSEDGTAQPEDGSALNAIQQADTEMLDTQEETGLPQTGAAEKKQESRTLGIRLFAMAGMAIWLAGVLVMAGMSIIRGFRFRKRLIGAVCWQKNIYLSDYVAESFVAGLVKPRIYLPSGLDLAARRYVLLHEQFHIKRRDYLVKPMFYVALCLHWFNPLVWAAFYYFVNDMEMSCDEAVLGELDGDARSEYSELLLRLSVGTMAGKAAAPISFGEGGIKMRIKNIMQWKKPRMAALVPAMLVCVVFASCAAANPKDAANQDTKVMGGRDYSASDAEGENNSVHIDSTEPFLQEDVEPSSKNDGEGTGVIFAGFEPYDDANAVPYIVKWAQNYVVKDNALLLPMTEEGSDAYAAIQERVTLSSPWPMQPDERAYDIVFVGNGHACILYYAVAGGHMTVWRELLEYKLEDSTFRVVNETLQWLDAIDNITAFTQAYPYGYRLPAGQEVMLAGTKMDYEAVGLAGVLALDSSNRYHNPVDAARNLLNLSSEPQKVSVATTEAANGEERGTVSVLVTFTEDAVGKNQVLIRMKQADVGVWLPQSYKCITGEYRIY